MKSIADEKTLPHDLEAEKATLGAVILRNEVYPFISPILGFGHRFYREAHQTIWLAICKVLDRPHGQIDLVTLCDELGKSGQLETCGGPSYIAALIDGVPRTTNAVHYAEIVAEKALLRDMVRAGDRLVTEAYIAEDSARDILLRHDRTILTLHHSKQETLLPVSASVSGLMERLEHFVQTKGQMRGTPTGFEALDRLTLGLAPGMIVVAARPSIGKTTFCLNVAEHACQFGDVALFSLEQEREPLLFRLLSGMTGVPASAMKRGFLSDATMQGMTQGFQKLREAPIWIDDVTGKTVSDLRADLRRLTTDRKLALVVLDYVQLMAADPDTPKGSNRTQQLTRISLGLKHLSREFSVPFIVVSQLSRAGMQRHDPVPLLTDLRETGALEQDADQVIFLHRRDHREAGITNCILAKNREGEIGTVDLWLNRETTRFTTPTDDQIGQAKEQAEAAAAEERHREKTRAIIRAQSKKRA